MDLEKLKVVAVRYFEEKIGKSPDTLEFTVEDHQLQEWSLDATLGERLFEIDMWQGNNLMTMREKYPTITFAEAAALAGYDRNLENLE